MRRALGISLAVLALALFGGCAGDDDRSLDPTASDGAPASVNGFGDLPLPAGATPAGERSEIDGVIARSFFVPDTTAEEVLDFYRDTFAGRDVDVVAGPAAAGDAWRGVWLIDEQELLVSAIKAPTGSDGSEQATTQLSLSLYPPGTHADLGT